MSVLAHTRTVISLSIAPFLNLQRSTCKILTLFSLVFIVSNGASALTCQGQFSKDSQQNESQMLASEFSIGSNPYQLPSDFDEMSDIEKMEEIWYRIYMSRYDINDLPEYYRWQDFLKIIKAALTLKRPFTSNHYFMKSDRPKFIHPRGSVGSFKFIPAEGSPATGMWSQEQNGFVRFSVAIPQKDNFLPGAALKYMRSGLPPINTHLMPSLDGQGADRNYFANSISNKLDEVSGGSIGFLAKAFEFLSGKNPFFLDVTEFGEVNKQGDWVENPVAPVVVRYEPTEESSQIISPDSTNDFRFDLNQVPVGTKLWKLYGRLTVDGPEFLMGTIVLTSELVASEAGDRLRFLHTGYPKGPDGAPE